MNKTKALKAILAISVFGTLFSGVLSYQELFGSTAATCPAPGAPGTVLGYPACIYGFFMYAILVVVAFWGLKSAKSKK